MSKLADLLEFYGTKAWQKDSSGILVPTNELIADRGRIANDYARPTEKGLPTEDIVRANYHISAADVAECLRDICLAMNMPPTQHRSMTIGSLCVRLQNAEYRLRMVTRT